MNKKRLSYLLSILLLTILITSQVLIVGAAPPYQGETDDELTNDLTNQYVDPEGDNPTPLTDGLFTYLETPYFSDDGNSLHNANLPRLLIADPNPEMQDLRFPQDPDIATAIAGTRSTGATFTINYKSSGTNDPWDTPCITFPTSARTAFAAAAAIWASRIQSSVPITISACWTSTLPSGVLGYSGGGTWHRNFSGAPVSNTWYQAALANSLAGSDLDTTNADMHITYSASFNWYYGTDGNTPAGQYDLVSVAAHEITHGLHFAGMMEYSGGSARYGWGTGYPSIYERFMESGGGTKLTSYTNPSVALGTLVTSNNLWWNGTNANAANGGGRVKMYAPSSWSSGSSYSHLDYTTFSGTINSLMVYAIGSGSSQHNPGPVIMGILKDMGWRTGSPPPIPTGVSASDGTFTDKVRVSWGGSGSFDYKIFLPLILKGGAGPTPEAPYFEVFRNTTNSTSGATKLDDHHPASPYDDISAATGTTYYYWVKACNSAGCSDFSASDSGYRAGVVMAPSPPTSVAASDGTYTDRVQVSWAASGGATYYQVFRHTSNNSSSAISLTSNHPSSPYNDTSAATGTTYYYWVKACNTGGCSGFSASDSGYRASEVTTPFPPTGVSASDGTYTDKVLVSWATSAGATSYQVFRHTTNNSASATTLTGSHPSSPYDDTSATAGTTYYYWVKACNSAGCSGFSSSDSGYRATEVTTPSPPTGVSASDGIYTDKVQVSWATSAGATHYQVFRYTSNNSSSATSLTSSHPSSPYDDTSAATGTTYYYWVKACNSAGCSGFSSSDSGYRATEVTTPSPPTGVSASDGTFTDKVQVSWSASAGATHYQVFRHTSDNSSSATSLTNSHPSSPYDDTSAMAGTTYYYWVKACNSAGCSGFSASDSGFRQEASGGFNSQFDGHAEGWISHSGIWYIDSEMEVLWTEGIEGTSASVSYTTDFDNFDYQVKMGRLGSDTSSNRIYVRGTPSPLLSGNRWYSGYAFQYSRNGQYSIFKFMPNGDTVQIQGWTSSSAINQGDFYNILRVVANGSDFSFYINGTLVWQGSDTSFSTGRVGISMYRAASTGLTEQLIVDWAVLTTLGPGGAGDSGSTDPIMQDPERIINEMIIDGDDDQFLIP